MRSSKYKDIFAKGHTSNWSDKVFVISKIKNTVAWGNVLSDLSGEEIIWTFYKKELQKTKQKEIGVESKEKEKKIYMLYGKVMIILWILPSEKKTL